MNETYGHLFTSLTIKGKTTKNRIVMPPMVTLYGVTSDRSIAYYEERARGGVGAIIVEAVAIFRFQHEIAVESLAPLAERIHAYDVLGIVQLFVQDRADPGDKLWPPSVARKPADVPTDELRMLQQQLAHAARVCRQAGFDGVEVHGAHQFFLNKFFCPEQNQRTDEYGGSLEGRMRMGLECVRAAREATDDAFLIFYRHTVEWDGYGIDDSIAFARRLEADGVDVLDISPSITNDGVHAGLAAAIKGAVHIPVVAVNGMNDPSKAEAALANGKCDLVAVGRGLLADPSWPQKTQEGRVNDIIQCVECGELCHGNLSQGLPIGCVQNPRTGHEYDES